ncbi:hypothetical protein GCM10010472_12270 [Pseudonocardia halophobica]|uniref:Uncharacterized protein n=1 Tax=Pseudonocardia halophobica TaxID=29401 RepID=A0A9W6L1C3_9PSEU|nr:hypothetical protein [Pseudonocardia halophobica]GLL11897.1 hypothetical protein GCM10017577_30380 [Pseudonocardia halophobica]
MIGPLPGHVGRGPFPVRPAIIGYLQEIPRADLPGSAAVWLAAGLPLLVGGAAATMLSRAR